MFEHMENLKLIDVLRRPASRYREFKSRNSHGFVFKISGESIYHFENREIIHKAGELLFIPKGEKYRLRCDCEQSEYLLINFDADIENPQVQKYSLDGYFELDFIFENLEKLWLFGDTSEKYKCISIFYDIIAFITHIRNTDYHLKRKLSLIDKATEYLEEHIFDSSLKSGELAVMCNMSDTYFRKIFKSNYGLNPREYINAKRLSRARAVIASGDYETISEVAHSVGFDDALYFSKSFKAKYGVAPSEHSAID